MLLWLRAPCRHSCCLHETGAVCTHCVQGMVDSCAGFTGEPHCHALTAHHACKRTQTPTAVDCGQLEQSKKEPLHMLWPLLRLQIAPLPPQVDGGQPGRGQGVAPGRRERPDQAVALQDDRELFLRVSEAPGFFGGGARPPLLLLFFFLFGCPVPPASKRETNAHLGPPVNVARCALGVLCQPFQASVDLRARVRANSDLH